MKERICACGCGQTFTPKDPRVKFIKGHISQEAKERKRLKLIQANASRKVVHKEEDYPFCACGCGQRVKNIKARFLKGHSARDPEICKKTLENLKKTMLEKYGVENAANLQSTVDKRKQTCLEKYGVDNPSKSKEIIDKISNTMHERYGVDWATQKSDYKEKLHKTCMEKYGVEHYTQLDSVKEKAKQTNLEKYGVEYYQQSEESKEHYRQMWLEHFGVEYAFQSDEIKQKIRETLNEKYGVDNIMFLPETLEKIKSVNLEKYGVEWSLQNEEVKQKSIKTLMERYGVDNISKNEDCIKNVLRTLREKRWNIMINNNQWVPNFEKEYFLDNGWIEYKTGKINSYEFKCCKCGNIINLTRFTILPRCHKCNPYVGRSRTEVEVFDFIKELLPDVEVEHSNRNIIKPKELDVYIPSKNIAIEFNGLYWHSITWISDPMYHLQKTKEYQEKGIQLIHVMEDEWANKPEITKSRIKNLLGLWENTVYARKCIIKEIKEPSVYMKFLNENHIQGAVGCKHAIGLYYNDELISLMTFGALRKALGSTNKENEYELLRFCNKLNYHIPGGASRLFKYFINTYKPNKIISYADRRWSNGNLYYKLGFNLHHSSLPNYWYIDPMYSYREYRFKYRKSELPKLLEHFDPEISEQQNMLDNGFNIIYDCGNMVFEWIKI